MYQINKGIDRPPEVGDIRGMNYLIYLAGAAVGGMVLSTIIMFMGVPAMYTYSTFLVLLIALYFFLANFSKKHGENGMARHFARNRYPTVIRVRNSRPFRVLVQKPTKP